MFQVRHGIDIDGEIGFKTMAAMNINVDERIEQIKINLERWRWLSRQFGDYYVKVNIADFNLEVIKNGEKIRQHKIIVGRTYRKTPIFSSKITHLVFNPSWTVPPGILSADVLPAVRKNIRYLKNKNIYVYDKNGKIVIPSSVDWNSSVVKSYTYRQTPGSDNALGSVKFFIPNEFMVYLHDTPSKDLFEKTERAFSSGCIRVQDPLELAEYLLNDPENYSKKRINGIINTKKTQTVVIKDQPAIHILYWTSFTNDDGVVQFRSDIYKRDGPLKEALLKRAPSL
jgi:murein L,D-transpeptidase YcbB/YkuD